MTRDEIIAIFEDMLGRFEGVPRKGKTMPYSALGGNMFVFVSPEGDLCLRLSSEDKAEYEARFKTGDVLQYGKVMRGYVTVTKELLSDPDRLDSWFAKSLEFVKSLDPK